MSSSNCDFERLRLAKSNRGLASDASRKLVTGVPTSPAVRMLAILNSAGHRPRASQLAIDCAHRIANRHREPTARVAIAPGRRFAPRVSHREPTSRTNGARRHRTGATVCIWVLAPGRRFASGFSHREPTSRTNGARRHRTGATVCTWVIAPGRRFAPGPNEAPRLRTPSVVTPN
jgi:hypothetical protein